MAYVPGFRSDVFISYSHIDNQSVQGPGWVADFHARFQNELEAEVGSKVEIWRDTRLGAADAFSKELDKQVRDTAFLLAIVSPGYLNSLWCEWELKAFVDGTRRRGDLYIDSKSRAIKVIKRPAEGLAHRDRVLPETTGLAFFETDRASNRSYELSPTSDAYRKALADLAQEIRHVLHQMRKARTIYLGTAPESLDEQRTKVKQELEAKEYRVLVGSDTGDPDTATDVRRAVEESSLTVHFIDRQTESTGSAPRVATLERDLAVKAGSRQLLVVRDEPGPPDRSWSKLTPEAQPANVDVLVDPATHALKQTIFEKLQTPVQAQRSDKLIRVYLICDRQDHPLLLTNRARSLFDHLRKLGFEVKLPLAEVEDASEFSRDNRNKLQVCDGVLLYWGGSRQSWFEERLIELTQALGWRQGRQFAASAAYVADPPNLVKQNYETLEVEELIKQFDSLDVNDERLTRFVNRLSESA